MTDAAAAGRPPGRTVPGNRWDLLDGLHPDPVPLVSVVVVHYRQPRQLDRTLAALARQTHPADRLEVIVVDDGSPEVPVVPPGVTLLRRRDEGFRAAAARNLGARHARGDVLCFLDADTAPEPGYVERLSRLPALAPEAVTVGRRRHADLSGVPAGAPIEAAAPPVALASPAWLAEGYAASGDLLAADDRSYRYVISAVLACSRWWFEELGGFDERFDAYGGEDWEWAYRAWLAGAILAHVPEAVAWHDGPDWSGREAGGAARRAEKHRETLRLADAIPVAGSRGHGLRPSRADVLIRLPPVASVAAAYVCVDSLLAAVPAATVIVPDALASTFAADPRVIASPTADDDRLRAVRIVVDVERPARVVGGGELRAALARVATDALGTLELLGADDATLVRVTSRRAAARAGRWGAGAAVPAVRERAPWLEPIAREPDLEAYVGGWA